MRGKTLPAERLWQEGMFGLGVLTGEHALFRQAAASDPEE
jgi:hypothetical protein